MKKLCLFATATLTSVLVGAGSVTAMAAGYQVYQVSPGNGGEYYNMEQITSFPGGGIYGLKLPAGESCGEIGEIIWGNNMLPGQKPEFKPEQKPEFKPEQKPEFKPEQKPGEETPGNQSEFARQVVQLVNEERAKAGLSPLSVDGRTSTAAGVRAREVEQSFSHTRPNGSDFSTALKESGVTFSAAGENIAYGQRTPKEVMDGWMNSAGHRANILNPNFTAIGVGHYQNSSGTSYWTQLFIK